MTVTESGELSCPRCAVALQETRGVESAVQGCDSCGGVWVDHETLGRLGQNLRDAKVLASRVAIRGRARVLDHREIGCPVCTTTLHRARVPGTDVDVDYCAAHGTWLDWGEIVPFIVPDADDPHRDFTVEELTAAEITAGTHDGFFKKLSHAVFRK